MQRRDPAREMDRTVWLIVSAKLLGLALFLVAVLCGWI